MHALFHRGVLPIGVEIGAGEARIAQLRQSGRGLALVAVERVPLPLSINDEFDPLSGDVVRALAEGLHRRVAGRAFVGNACAVSVADSAVRVRSVRLPLMSDDETDRALRIDAAQRLGFSDKEAAEYGWVRAGEVRQNEEVREEAILVGALREHIENLVYALNSVGLRPLSVEPSFLALGRCYSRTYRRAADQDVVRVVVDVGRRTTGVIVLRGPGVAFFKLLEIGGDAMTLAGARRLGLDPVTVGDLRAQRMRADGPEAVEQRVDHAMFQSARPLMEEIAQEAALCVRYFGVTFRGARPVRCVISGECAREPRLAEIVGQELRLETGVGEPLSGIDLSRCARTESLHHQGAEFSAALGLSLGGLRERVTSRAGDRRSTPRSKPQSESTPPGGRKAAA